MALTVVQYRVAGFFLVQHTKTVEKLNQLALNIPNASKTYQMRSHKIDQMDK
jgi:hypothetical protein